MTAYSELMAFERETQALGQVMWRLGWDMQTMMPSGAAEQRGEEMAALEGVLHGRRSDPRVGEWLVAATPENAVEARQIELIQREFDLASKVPQDLAQALTRKVATSHQIWAKARAADDFAMFAPALTEVLALTREKAAALADGGDHYDALLDSWEPGATAAGIAEMFDELRVGLVALRERVLGAERTVPELDRPFDEAKQMALSAKLADAFGYDLSRGRIDKAVHPFMSGSGLDTRMTTRTEPNNPFNCFYSTIHETGHASYEQGIDRSYLLTPLGAGVSLGVHESQSRIFENQLGRSRAFTGWLFERMKEEFGDFGVHDADTFYATVNRCAPGYIRTEADEVHYNLHIMLRFDLERELFAGRLEVADLPEAWNARFEADFGVVVDKPSNGVLQDVHWSEGIFGYFPTYSLGNVYAGCLHEALRTDLPDLDAALAEGDPSAAVAWLRENVHRHGGLYKPREVIEQASGQAVSVQPLLNYLDGKFGEIYGV